MEDLRLIKFNVKSAAYLIIVLVICVVHLPVATFKKICINLARFNLRMAKKYASSDVKFKFFGKLAVKDLKCATKMECYTESVERIMSKFSNELESELYVLTGMRLDDLKRSRA